jgi:hypothetical protein
VEVVLETVMKKSSISEAVRQSSLFGPPLLLEGEDSAAYEEMVGRLYAAAKPVDVIDEMFTADVACQEWEILRWRRVKFRFLRLCAHRALAQFLSKSLDFEEYRKEFIEDLTPICAAPEDQSKVVARKLAHDCAGKQVDAMEKVNKILASNGLTMELVCDKAQKRKAEELTEEFARGERRAITVVQKQLAEAGLNIDDLVVRGIQGKGLDFIERIDRLSTIAESRRNASLREIERRRPALGQTLRRSVQEIENDTLKVIEPPLVKGKHAA